MNDSQPTFPGLVAKTAVCHTLTYFLMGALAAYFLKYGEEFAKPGSGMRQLNDPWVMAGPLFQPLRGLVFASVFYPLRNCLFGRKFGWLIMAWLLIAVGILSTFGPAPASIEGMIYTTARRISNERLARSRPAGTAAFGVAVLLGESSCKVAQLAAGSHLRDRHGAASSGTASEASALIRAFSH